MSGVDGKSVAVDSNLLLLLVVGRTRRAYVAKHKRLDTFVAEDFDLLWSTLSQARTIVVTPNTLTETSNLIDHIGNPDRTAIYGTLRAMLHRPSVVEHFVESRAAAARTELARLGLSDCGLLEIAAAGTTLLTVDLHLYLAAIRRGHDAVNFNHLRALGV